MAVELKKTADMLAAAKDISRAQLLDKRVQTITDGIWEHGVVTHKKYGRVFAYEVDGYGSQILMDDANVPSLLALPIMGFLERDDPVYLNTRKMLLEKEGNPYYLKGLAFRGIGGMLPSLFHFSFLPFAQFSILNHGLTDFAGPHIGFEYAWPMSLLLQAMTSDNDKEISDCIKMVLTASPLGLVHESINVNRIHDYTRTSLTFPFPLSSQQGILY